MLPDVTAPEDRVVLSSSAQEQVAEALVTASGLPSLTASERLEIRADLESLARVNPGLAAQAETMIATRRTPATTNLVAAQASVPSLKLLSVTHQAQANGYYCGPATASMIVRYKGKNLSQSQLAGSAYLRTTSSAGTPWASKRMVLGLNEALGSERYQQVQSPSTAVLKGAFVNSTSSTFPLAVSTVEFAGGAHDNGHPVTRTIGHWIVGRGQNSSGATLMFMDPATSVYAGAAKTFSMSASSFQGFVQTNGIAW